MRKKFYLTGALALVLASSLSLQSCIGSFALTNKVLRWNNQVGSKFVNELVFCAFWILPVYELTALADLLVLNSVEFWSGSNPVEARVIKVDGKDAQYLVKSDATGYTITNTADKTEVRFNFDASDNSWSVMNPTTGEDVKFMQWVDESHVKMVAPGGEFTTVSLDQSGVMAYQAMVQNSVQFAMR